MEPFDTRAVKNVRRPGRRLFGLFGVVAVLAGSIVALGAGAGTAGATQSGTLSGVSVTLSTNAAGATEVDYNAAFTASATGALDANTGTITLSTSGSTIFPSDCSYTVTDITTGQSTETCPSGSATSTVTISAGIAVNNGDKVKVAVTEVANASSTGSQTFTVSTSSDHAASTSFSLVAAGSVSGVSVSLSTNAAGANVVDYTAAFTASSTGFLDANNGTITLSTSGSTIFSSDCQYAVTDVTTGQSTETCPTGSVSSSVTINARIAVNSGDKVKVAVTSVANASSTGSQTFTVSTSSDHAASTSFSLVAAGSVSGVSVNLSTNAAGATEVDYNAAFTASATGALDANHGTITLSTSGSTIFPSNCSYTVTDVTTGQSWGTCPIGSVSSSVTISAGIAVNNGDNVTVAVTSVANASSTGSQTFTVSTSSDHAASTSFSLVAAGSVSGVSVSLSTTAAGATEVDYNAAFTASAIGALDVNNGTIILSTSGSTIFPSNCSYTVTDITTGQSTETCPTGSATSSVTISAGIAVNGGDSVTVAVKGMANTTSIGSQTFSVSTSSDHAASTTFSIVAASPVTAVSVKLSVTTISSKSKYTVAFTTSSTGALDPNKGTITFVGPSGTVFPFNCTYVVTDVTTASSSTACPNSVQASGVVISNPGLNIRAGDKISVTVAKVKNAKTTGKKSLSVSTSSDLAAKGKYTLT
jgi:hypothetical protein